MDELYKKSYELVKNNVACDIGQDTLDIIVVAVFGLLLTKPELVLKKIPEILHRLNIISDERSVLKISHEDLENYMEDDSLGNATAAVTRALNFDDNKENVKEDWTMIISLEDIDRDSADLIIDTIHELTHLLRFGGILDNGKKYKIKDGISVNYINKEDFVVKRKHFYFEDAIVEQFTKKVVANIYEYLKDNEIEKDSLLDKCKNRFSNYKNKSYEFHVAFIDMLCTNPTFDKLLDETFEDNNSTNLTTYYNSIMNSSNAFTSFSKKIDEFSQSIINEDKGKAIEKYEDIHKEIILFLNRAKTKELKR